MSVQVHLTFNTVDDAIVALGKMALPVKAVAPKEPTPPVEKTPRQARSDAGKPRGPYKKDEQNAAGAGAGATSAATAGNSSTVTTDPSNAGKQAAASTSTTTAAPGGAALHVAPSTNAPAAPDAPIAVPTPEQVQAAVEKLFTAKGYEDTEATLSRFGVKRGKDLREDQRFDFIVKADRVIAGEAI